MNEVNSGVRELLLYDVVCPIDRVVIYQRLLSLTEVIPVDSAASLWRCFHLVRTATSPEPYADEYYRRLAQLAL